MIIIIIIIYHMKMLINQLLSVAGDYKIKEVIIGTFDIGVLNTKKCGIATSMRDFGVKGGHPALKNLGNFESMTTRPLANYLKSDILLEASLGAAALNSSLPEIDEEKLKSINASELVIKHGEGKNVGVIGHFPFIKKLKKRVNKLYVFGKPPLKGELPPEKESLYLPDVDLAVISGTSFINHTFREIMEYVRDDAYVIVLGPSAPLTPVLFDYGVDALCGTIVKSSATLLKYLKHGATFRDLKGKRLVTITKEGF
ncbi:MAG: DUF364 domain-containing protein, partial [Elusimicrobia bacterium]|jgi:uncharacterized protein (DUF4213/DUF364 family)|nr:DUF364 domain-containing protein [Elusimicrobiota bacterium]